VKDVNTQMWQAYSLVRFVPQRSYTKVLVFFVVGHSVPANKRNCTNVLSSLSVQLAFGVYNELLKCVIDRLEGCRGVLPVGEDLTRFSAITTV
jgi:hypothetical protein